MVNANFDRSCISNKSFTFYFLLFTFYFLLFTFYFLLFTFYFLLFTFYFLLFTFYFLLFTFYFESPIDFINASAFGSLPKKCLSISISSSLPATSRMSFRYLSPVLESITPFFSKTENMSWANTRDQR